MKIIFIIILSVIIFSVNSYKMAPKSPQQVVKDNASKLSQFVGYTLPLGIIASKPEISKAFTFDPIPHETRPDASDAAVAYSGIKPDFAAVRKDIDEIIKSRPDKGPTLVRLAWHSSGTYDKVSKTGGSNGGTIRFKDELSHGANAGLDTAMIWLDPIYKKYNKVADLSYADLYTLAGIQAIKTLGGPDIAWRAGREDFLDESKATPDGRLPDADKGKSDKTSSHLRDIFYRMGFNDQEIVALAGAHALGRCHPGASGYIGPWSPTPTTFNNAYYTLLLNVKWEPDIGPKTPKFQYKDPSGKLMMLPSDIALIEDKDFKPYVEKYAKNQKEFFKDFSAAFQKLTELGTSNLYDV